MSNNWIVLFAMLLVLLRLDRFGYAKVCTITGPAIAMTGPAGGLTLLDPREHAPV